MPISVSNGSAIDSGHRGEIFGQYGQVLPNLLFAWTKQVRSSQIAYRLGLVETCRNVSGKGCEAAAGR